MYVNDLEKKFFFNLKVFAATTANNDIITFLLTTFDLVNLYFDVD